MHYDDDKIAVASKFQKERQFFFELCRQGLPGVEEARSFARTISTIIASFFGWSDRYITEGKAKYPWAIIGVGGLGRGELSFLSDIDILFLYKKKLDKSFHEKIRKFTYSLWDGGFELGHNTLSLGGAIALARENFSVMTSHITSRLIVGSEELFRQWQNKLRQICTNPRGRKSFFTNLKEYVRHRLKKYGDSSYLLEPHIKEGIGGLRDVHMVRWISWILHGTTAFETLPDEMLSKDEKLWLIEAENFLWQVRLQLHAMIGRRQDQIYFADLEKLLTSNLDAITPSPSIKNTLKNSANFLKENIEEFMRVYYQHTSRIRRVSTFLFERYRFSIPSLSPKHFYQKPVNETFLIQGKHIQFLDPNILRKSPEVMMKLFKEAALKGLHFHHNTGQVIRNNLPLIDDGVRNNPEVIEDFFDILMNTENGPHVLKMMLETGFLQRLIPEFQHVRHRVQYDAYHLYTVDEHLMRTVKELHILKEKNDSSLEMTEALSIMDRIKSKKVLFLAALLHDIGKGYEKKHAEEGALLASDICDRLRLSEEEKNLVIFLIRHHLLLADTALKRDLSDEKPIVKCAAIVENLEKLDMLYLLTIADSKATGPSAWNTWRASLLRELYGKVKRMLTDKDWQSNVGNLINNIQEEVSKLCNIEETPSLKKWLESLSHRYILNQDHKSIINHFRMESKISKSNPLVIENSVKEKDIWQITIVTYDRPGLFALITGVLWCCGVNILSADIFTRGSGIAVDIILVNDIPDPLHPERLWEKFERDLKESLKERSYLNQLISSRKKSYVLRRYLPPVKPDKVIIDEESSDFYTIIEVYTWDRPGVLHTISEELFKLGISIQLAKITTPGAQVADVFYVTDLEGSKIMNTKLYTQIEENILKSLQELR